MDYDLGIDVGTTYTAAAISRAGVVEAIPLSTYQVAVPSVMFITEGEMLYGAPAARRGAVQPEGLAREFKRRVGDPVPIMLSGSPYHADRLTALMAKWVVDTVSEQLGGSPRQICLAHPANWTEYQLGVLGNAVVDVGLTDLGMISEPAAAALDYASATAVAEGSLLLVYDLGGGTFDVAMLRRRGDGFEHEIEPFGIERLGGIDFDEAVFSHVIANVPPAVLDTARQSTEGTTAIANLRRTCVDAKEALSSDASTDVPVMLPAYTASVRLTRAEFEAMIRPMVEQTIAGVKQTIQRAGIEPTELNAALLVGGSSRIPLVSQMVAEELGVPVRVDAHPKLVVAKGAARRAAVAVPVTRTSSARRRAPGATGRDDERGRNRWAWVAVAAAALAGLALVGWLVTRADDGDGTSTAATVSAPPSVAVSAASSPPSPPSVSLAVPVPLTAVSDPETLAEWIDYAIAEFVQLDDRNADEDLEVHGYAWIASSIAARRSWDDPLVTDYLDKVYALQNPDGGYGIATDYDSFDDGSKNPADTTYAVTLTDHVGRTLLEGYAAGVVPAARVEEIISIVESFPLADVPGTCIAYSTAPADRPYCVDNANASAALFLTSAADAGFDVDLSRVDPILDRERAAMIDGVWWPYHSGKPAERNDWQHNAMEVEAFLDLDPAVGTVAFDAMRQLDPVPPTPPSTVDWAAPGRLPEPTDQYDAAARYRLAPHDCSLADPEQLGRAVSETRDSGRGDAEVARRLAILAYLGTLAAQACPTT